MDYFMASPLEITVKGRFYAINMSLGIKGRFYASVPPVLYLTGRF